MVFQKGKFVRSQDQGKIPIFLSGLAFSNTSNKHVFLKYLPLACFEFNYTLRNQKDQCLAATTMVFLNHRPTQLPCKPSRQNGHVSSLTNCTQTSHKCKSEALKTCTLRPIYHYTIFHRGPALTPWHSQSRPI